jgi:hypothetical protein
MRLLQPLWIWWKPIFPRAGAFAVYARTGTEIRLSLMKPSQFERRAMGTPPFSQEREEQT